LGIQFDHALPRPRLQTPVTALSESAKSARGRRPLARLDAFDIAAGRSSGVLGAGANPGRTTGHGGEAAQWRVVEAQLATRRFIEGDDFTLADIALGAYARRWFGVEGIIKPRLRHLERWFSQFDSRPGFTQFIAPPMS
jgi:hypothetical protein